MVVQQPVDAATVGCKLAELIRDAPGVKDLWLHTHPDRVDAYLIVDAIDVDAELRLLEATDALYDAFSNPRVDMFVLNPLNFIEGTDLRDEIPSGAQQVLLGD